jgi:hypothetical protein
MNLIQNPLQRHPAQYFGSGVGLDQVVMYGASAAPLNPFEMVGV